MGPEKGPIPDSKIAAYGTNVGTLNLGPFFMVFGSVVHRRGGDDGAFVNSKIAAYGTNVGTLEYGPNFIFKKGPYKKRRQLLIKK